MVCGMKERLFGFETSVWVVWRGFRWFVFRDFCAAYLVGMQAVCNNTDVFQKETEFTMSLQHICNFFFIATITI